MYLHQVVRVWNLADSKRVGIRKYGGYILAFNGGKIVECSTKKQYLNEQ